MSVTITDKSRQFADKNGLVLDQVLGLAAIDVERLAKMQVPQRTSRLQNTIVHRRVGPMKFIIPANTPYARRWHEETPPHGFNNGRKSHYLSDPGDLVAKQLPDRIKAAVREINV